MPLRCDDTPHPRVPRFAIGLDERLAAGFRVLVAEFARRRMRERDHLVGIVRGGLGLARESHRAQGLLQQLLQIRLPGVDDVVDRGRAAEGRGTRS